ncbi:hypothetical protein AVEN_261386-1 [Araneus ventricosus]|uniref:Uncharacterized protein n=1 Tax=Araneus ventricosus TaxID=182803 RepID=A0A4Y2PIC6_ARAVE|nr:hypothetical protein AVEN_261386-1 [Araneus ventricosus]
MHSIGVDETTGSSSHPANDLPISSVKLAQLRFHPKDDLVAARGRVTGAQSIVVTSSMSRIIPPLTPVLTDVTSQPTLLHLCHCQLMTKNYICDFQ